jgi:hypothetical protein
MSNQLKDLEEKYKSGIDLLKQKDYYDSLISEIEYLVKYIDSAPFTRYFSDNLFSDIQGVFGTFIKVDLKKIYEDFLKYPEISLDNYYDKESMNLEILRKCATNLNYQVKSIIRLPKIQKLPFQSRYIKATCRKFYGEIQLNYRELESNYKKYFRKKFTLHRENNDAVTMACMKQEIEDYDTYFGNLTIRFEDLLMALRYVREYFNLCLEEKIIAEIGPIFNNQDRYNKLISYFINDLKRTFIQIMYRQVKKGKKFLWIQNVSLEFLQSERFSTLLKKVIFHTFSIIRKNSQRPKEL